MRCAPHCRHGGRRLSLLLEASLAFSRRRTTLRRTARAFATAEACRIAAVVAAPLLLGLLSLSLRSLGPPPQPWAVAVGVAGAAAAAAAAGCGCAAAAAAGGKIAAVLRRLLGLLLLSPRLLLLSPLVLVPLLGSGTRAKLMMRLGFFFFSSPLYSLSYPCFSSSCSCAASSFSSRSLLLISPAAAAAVAAGAGAAAVAGGAAVVAAVVAAAAAAACLPAAAAASHLRRDGATTKTITNVLQQRPQATAPNGNRHNHSAAATHHVPRATQCTNYTTRRC